MKKGLYKHFKGKTYEVIGFATHSETQEELVIYKEHSSEGCEEIWARPKTMFEETVAIDGKTVPRFSFVS